MSGQIEVNSLSALENLEAAIARFSSRFSEALADAEREIARKRDRLDEITDGRRRAVSYWRQVYDAADPEEDDVGAIARRLEAAEDGLTEARRWQARVEELCDGYRRKAGQGKLLCAENTRKARAVLKQKIAELYAYASLQPEVSAGGGGIGLELGSAAERIIGRRFRVLGSDSREESPGFHRAGVAEEY
jgi:hypothetical protein